MDGEAYSNVEFPSNLPTHLESASYGGSVIFSGSQNFTVAGGLFKSVTNNYTTAATVPPDNVTGVVGRRQSGRQNLRRVYSASVEGHSLTVAMYQGHGAEEEWRKEMTKYMSLRQVSRNLHVALDVAEFYKQSSKFRSDLCSCKFWWDTRYTFSRRSDSSQTIFGPISTFTDRNRLHTWFKYGSSPGCNAPFGSVTQQVDYAWSSYKPGICSFSTPDTEAMTFNSLTFNAYHEICSWNLVQDQPITVPLPTTVNLGVIIRCSSNELKDCVEIAFLTNVEVDGNSWENSRGPAGEVTEHGWTRTITMSAWTPGKISWLTQANHIFARLQITSDFEDYALINEVAFRLNVGTTNDPLGYLFLCPQIDFQIGPSSFGWSNSPAYWSLDPAGAERLRVEEAIRLSLSFDNGSQKRLGCKCLHWIASVPPREGLLSRQPGCCPPSRVPTFGTVS
ncbi:hypothetical protein C8J57DRAFT_1476017 [Mycena rebaudengoi]|nr:hypothetical protein C8J57DRAFT_1476017 [Mycena rebaudengoi]